jgi:hypothetical protein
MSDHLQGKLAAVRSLTSEQVTQDKELSSYNTGNIYYYSIDIYGKNL